jgi:hypothetical protein
VGHSFLIPFLRCLPTGIAKVKFAELRVFDQIRGMEFFTNGASAQAVELDLAMVGALNVIDQAFRPFRALVLPKSTMGFGLKTAQSRRFAQHETSCDSRNPL